MNKSRERTIMLLDPPYYRLFKNSYSLPRYPLSLGYLAGAIKRNTDWNVVAYNADFTAECEPMRVSHLAGKGFDCYLQNLRNPSSPIWSQIQATIEHYQPAVVGISCKSQTFGSAMLLARIVKQLDPHTTVIVGGPHASMTGTKLLDRPDVDIVVRGEGEETIVELLGALENGVTSLDEVRGIAFRTDGKIVETPPRPYAADLDAMSFPHETAPDVLHDYDRYPPSAFSHVFATRGCPYNCFFCGSRNIWGRKVRFRSADNVAAQIKALLARGVTSVHFDDDTFGVNKRYIIDLCNTLIEHCPNLRWSCELHVNLVNDENVSLMRRAGCTSIQVGIESGSNEILTAIRKGFTIEQALRAVEVIRRNSVAVEAFFIVGFPQETEHTLAETETAMRKIDGRLTLSIFTPYPGTEAFEFCRDHNLIDDNYDASLYNHQSPANCFCLNISPQRFRTLVTRIERMVDRHNYPGTLSKIRRLGLVGSFKRLINGPGVGKA